MTDPSLAVQVGLYQLLSTALDCPVYDHVPEDARPPYVVIDYEVTSNADLLSPAALVDGTLGNRVTVTRTNPATGAEEAESAVVRTRADGGLVLQTAQGFEAVRCAGLPERLAFDRVREGLSAQPVFSIDTRDGNGGTYTVTLTYLAWGFDWQANYVATLGEGGADSALTMRLMSWLTILNDNNQTFADAQLMAVAGTLQVVSDFQSLADAPEGRPLRLTCYPLGSTAAGSPVPDLSVPPPPPPPPAPVAEGAIVVTGMRLRSQEFNSASPMVALDAESMAQEEQLGDLKLYRIPQAVTVNAQGLKQIAFLDLFVEIARDDAAVFVLDGQVAPAMATGRGSNRIRAPDLTLARGNR